MKSQNNTDIANSKKRIMRMALTVFTAVLLVCASAYIVKNYSFAAPSDNSATGNETGGVQGGAFEVKEYDFEATVSKDHSYDVTEKISVRIPDQLQSIEFAIPSGNFRISNIEVENASYAAKKASEASTVSIVDPAKLSEGSHEYTIKYRIQEYEDGDSAKDMFYFKVLLPEWKQPIGKVRIKVKFPDDFPWDDMQCYAGQFGVQDSTNKITFDDDEDDCTVTVTGDKIPENYGITLKAQLPEGYWEGALDGSWAITAIIAVLAGGAILLLLLWLIGGRDPKVEKETVTKPIEGLSPVELGYAFESRIDIADVVRLVLCFAKSGYLRICEYEPKRYRLLKLKNHVQEEKMFRTAYSILFEGVYKGRYLEMEDMGERLELIRRSITDDVAAGFASSENSAFTPLSRTFRYVGAALLGICLGLANAFSYSFNYLSVRYIESIIIAVIAALAALMLCRQVDARDSTSISASRLAEIGSGLIASLPAFYTAFNVFRNTGKVYLPAMIIVMTGISHFLIVIMRARGKKNAELVSKVRSLRSFIYHPTPKELLANYLEDPEYYYDMLVYALAFGAEESWAITFLTLDVKAPEWYSDDIEGHAFSNLREEPTTIDYARDLRSFTRTIENAYHETYGRR